VVYVVCYIDVESECWQFVSCLCGVLIKEEELRKEGGKYLQQQHLSH